MMGPCSVVFEDDCSRMSSELLTIALCVHVQAWLSVAVISCISREIACLREQGVYGLWARGWGKRH